MLNTFSGNLLGMAINVFSLELNLLDYPNMMKMANFYNICLKPLTPMPFNQLCRKSSNNIKIFQWVSFFALKNLTLNNKMKPF